MLFELAFINDADNLCRGSEKLFNYIQFFKVLLGSDM